METERERFDSLREKLMDLLEEHGDAEDDEIRAMIDDLVLADSGERRLSVTERLNLGRELFYSVRRLDILQDLIDDKSVTEIMVNGPDCIYVEQNGKIRKWERAFTSREKLEDVIQQIVGKCNRVVNEQNPIVDARLSDGSRVNAVIAPIALDGPILTIRQFPEEPITMEKLIRSGSITREAAEDLRVLVAAGYSMIIGGGTSAGKTTFLNALSNAIPKEERIITIEDNAELQIQGIGNLVRLEAKSANTEGGLRMRPDRIIVGEVRSGEAVDMLQAFNTGHDGSLCTIHANSCQDMLSRLEVMVLMAFPLPLQAIRGQIASGADVLVHLGRLRDRSRRVLEIAEVTGMENEQVKLNSLYKWDDADRSFKKTGELQNTMKLDRRGLSLNRSV